MYSDQHPAHSKCLLNISYCYKDDDAFTHSTNIYETIIYRGITGKQKYFCLHGICILVKGTDDKLYMSLFDEDECYVEIYIRVRRLGRLGEVTFI